ncbi:MAG: TonB-dependent receptor [Cellvibrionaceae bacterium]|nr:TonB-dependent receptor [Cellvibrionaceae bacterium]
MKFQPSLQSHSMKKLCLSIAAISLGLSSATISSSVFAQGAPSATQKQSQSYQLDIPQQALAAALQSLSMKTRKQITAASGDISELKSNAIQGNYTVEQALKLMLKDAPLEIVPVGQGFVIRGIEKQAREELMEEVLVTGSYTARSMNGATGLNMSLRETPQSVSIVTAQMIQDQGLEKMSELLQNTPGVSMVGDASEDYLIYVRGFQLDSAVQVDGLISTTANLAYSGSLSQGINPVVAERVEVLKGAAGILSGLGEPSATVNMIRKRPTDSFQGELALRAGRWSNVGADIDVSGPITDNSGARLVASYSQGDYFLDGYEKQNQVIYGIFETEAAEDLKLTLAIERQDRNSDGVYNWNSNPSFYTDGTPFTPKRSFSSGQPWAYRDVSETSVTPELEYQINTDWFVKMSYRYADGDIEVVNASLGGLVDKETGQLVPTGPPVPAALLSERESKTHSFNIYTTGAFDLFDVTHEVVLGYSTAKNEFELGATYSIVPFANINNLLVSAPDWSNPVFSSQNTDEVKQDGIYGTVRFSISDDLKLMLGGRVSSWEANSVSQAQTRDETELKDTNIVTPYAGIVYDINDYASIYASLTGIFKPQFAYDENNDLLDPTEGTNTEAGIKLAFFDNDLNISAAIYQSNKDKVAEFTGTQNEFGNSVYRSVDGIKTDGFEIEFAGAISANWNVHGGYTHNTAEDSTGKKRNTYIPDDVFKFSTTYDFDKYMEGLTLGISATWQSDTYSENTAFPSSGPVDTLQRQDSYYLIDIMGRYRINDEIEIGVNVNNILDETYNRSLWGFLDYGEPRNISASVRWQF